MVNCFFEWTGFLQFVKNELDSFFNFCYCAVSFVSLLEMLDWLINHVNYVINRKLLSKVSQNDLLDFMKNPTMC